MGYGLTITMNLPYEQAVPRVKEALQAQGFGTLTEADVAATLIIRTYVIPLYAWRRWIDSR